MSLWERNGVIMFTKCTKCDGEGIIHVSSSVVGLPYQLDICDVCHGDGELDWIERIIGKGPLSWEQKTELWRSCKNIVDRRWKSYEKYLGSSEK